MRDEYATSAVERETMTSRLSFNVERIRQTIDILARIADRAGIPNPPTQGGEKGSSDIPTTTMLVAELGVLSDRLQTQAERLSEIA